MIKERRDNRDTQRIKGFSDHCLLALISERPLYGFELIAAMDESRLIPNCAQGTVYLLLGRMEQQGLIQRYEEVGSTNRRRRYYRILPEGEEKLAEWNEDWSRFRQGMDSVLATDRS